MEIVQITSPFLEISRLLNICFNNSFVLIAKVAPYVLRINIAKQSQNKNCGGKKHNSHTVMSKSIHLLILFSSDEKNHNPMALVSILFIPHILLELNSFIKYAIASLKPT